MITEHSFSCMRHKQREIGKHRFEEGAFTPQTKNMMEESALDVLSRAATMLQEQSPVHLTNDEPPKPSPKQLPSSKWKRDRRNNQYPRKSPDQPSKPTTDPQQSTTATVNVNNGHHQESLASRLMNGDGAVDESPLDMSVRQRGLPPSYSQAINDPSFRSSYKASSVGQEVAKVGCEGGGTATGSSAQVQVSSRDELPSGISMCDPIIDEHFRRSLGKAYMTVFNNGPQQSTNNKDSTTTSNNTINKKTNNVQSSTSTKPNNHQTQAKSSQSSSSPNNNTSSSNDSSIIDDDADRNSTTTTTTNRRVIVNSAMNSASSDLVDGAGLTVDDHFAKALGDTWLKLNGKKDTSTSENGVLKTAGGNAVIENSLVSI